MALYDRIGPSYASFRRPDPRIARAIESALGDAQSVVNIGAGAGSYEPLGRTVIAVEPSEVMIRQRAVGASPCLRGTAESLPLKSAAVDAAMAILSAHHWGNFELGLREMARVARKRVVLLTWFPDVAKFWLTEDYFPQIAAHDRVIFPTGSELAAMLDRLVGPVRITLVPIPHDCRDGLLGAFWRRPECYLDASLRSAMSSFARIEAGAGLAKLRADLSSGRWEARNRELLDMEAIDLGYRIACCDIRPRK